ncbi:ribonuclease [Aeromicrobium flavum]|uniref:Ribonuclease n=1 Tax=Aeromicrobium flavum TaxID=416568 RepID=A0A512HQV2_9ACTN|nr:YihY/virulence factor BrkB family protein [Aeromicrobium flavum]GEO87834.1 ribonuclease [Aeromicrobium flavum]
MSIVRTAVTAWRQASARQAPLLAAGVAFYLFTSLFPALIAAVSIYGLVADPATVADQTERISEALPADAASLVNGQLEQLTSAPSGSLGLGAAVAILLAVYAASGGVGNLVTAINQLYGLEDARSFVARKALALGLTVAAVVFGLVAISLVAVVPVVLNMIDVVPGMRLLANVLRWVVLAGGIVVAIGILYRVAPDRPSAHGIVTRGVVIAAALWLLVSVGFSLYVDLFGNYSKTYGALAGVVVLLLWLWIGMYAILLGACVEAAREHIVTRETLSEDEALARRRSQEAELATGLDRFNAELDERLER